MSKKSTIDSEDNSFCVHCTGTVSNAHFGQQDGNGLYCRYVFHFGPDWIVLNGIDTGLSQTAKSNPNHLEEGIVWNFPIDVTFKSTNVHGWPRIAMSVYGIDFLGRDIVKGYASVLVPLSPGQHTLSVACFTPLAASWLSQWSNWLWGNPPEFFDSKFVAQAEGREVTRVQNTGSISLILNVTTKGMQNAGYAINDTAFVNSISSEC